MDEAGLGVRDAEALREYGEIGAERVGDAVHDDVNEQRRGDDYPAPATVGCFVRFATLVRLGVLGRVVLIVVVVVVFAVRIGVVHK